ncbi:MAG: hypothetical protein SPJ45_00620 [Anaerovoracaceae bacterium]|nr:hypothetical protein [Anaerovoracaceae bacterium]
MIKREERPLGLNIGSASIIMIFAILCLTVFSALSLVTSVSEKKTAQRFADETAAYYEADSEAVKIKNSIQAAIDAGSTPQQAAAANNAQYLTGQAAAALAPQIGPGTAGASQTHTGPGTAGASPNTPPDAIITYNVPLSDNISRITAVLTYNSKTNTLETLSWKKNNISEWSPDTDIDVWNGEDDPAENVTE